MTWALSTGASRRRTIIITSDGKAALTGFPGRDPGAEPMARFGKDAAEPGYVAPEQIADDPVGRRTDIYSLGVVAYAMLAGKDPFGASEGVAADDVFYRILYKPSPQVPEGRSGRALPASAGPAIERAMSKEPQSRFLGCQAASCRPSRTRDGRRSAAPVRCRAPSRKREPRAQRRSGSRAWMPYALAGGRDRPPAGHRPGRRRTPWGASAAAPGTTLARHRDHDHQAAAVDDSTTTTTTEPVTTTDDDRDHHDRRL